MKQTNSYIVISSDWRYDMRQCTSRLIKTGLNALIVGSTPIHLFNEKILDKSRGVEIETWWKDYPYYNNYVIIDDRTDMLEYQMNNFIEINPKIGLTDFDILKAISILKQE